MFENDVKETTSYLWVQVLFPFIHSLLWFGRKWIKNRPEVSRKQNHSFEGSMSWDIKNNKSSNCISIKSFQMISSWLEFQPITDRDECKNLSEGSVWKLAYNKLESLSQIFPIQISLPVNIFVQFATFADFFRLWIMRHIPDQQYPKAEVLSVYSDPNWWPWGRNRLQ